MLQRNMISMLLNSNLFLCFTLFCLSSIELVLTTTSAATITSVSRRFTNETDRQALLAIRDLIPGDLSSWNTSVHFCHWHGVTCSTRHQRVVVLNLSSRDLTGSLSPHIGNLTFLRKINLDNNAFHGTIPREIGHLFRLQYLYLSNNSFQGELPVDLTRCPELRQIDVFGNNLIGNIPGELGSLAKLVDLILSTNKFSGTIPPSLGNLSELHIFSLSRNNLEGNIPSELGQLSKLEFFQLSSNNFSGIVPALLYNISGIHFFSVADNKLYGNLPPDLGLTMPNLQRLYVGGNQFSGHIPATIGNASGLAHFETHTNFLSGPVPINLGSLQHLQLLNLAYNPLGANGTDEFSFLSSLTNCTNLKILNLDGDHFTGTLPHSVANLSTKLYVLSLNKNFVSGSIPPGIGKLANLEYLGLIENSITGSVPNSIGRLSKLQSFYIYTNKISGQIPPSIGNLTQLTELSLRGNMLKGSIPVSLGYCRNLQMLDLSDNDLSGAIPEQVLARASRLTFLFLDRNYLTGALPSQVGELKNLEKLDISDNTLSGEIPGTLGNCLTLEDLIMANNYFEGNIPSSFRQLRGIQVLDLSLNNLSGQIPSFLGSFPFISYLNLSFNYFEGEVPNEGIFRNISSFSASGHSNLCGGIKELGLSACSSKVSGKQGRLHSRRVIIIITTSVVLFTILLLAFIYVILYRKRSSKRKFSLPSPVLFPQLSYQELVQATNDFSPDTLVGKGRHGSVYKGILPGSDEQVVAVKVLHIEERGANKSFMAECEALKNIRHRNLVKIITSCSSIDFKGNDFKALVFEFMPNGSLERWLHPKSSEEVGNLNLVIQRLNIAIEIASALDYLHHHCEKPVVHCDLKPSNILLADDFTAHVGDFGLARFVLGNMGDSIRAQPSTSTAIRGTVGYVAPEYGMGTKISTEGDVYSYGILLMEMFTGKRPTDSIFTDNFSLHNFAKMSLPDRVLDIVDPLLIVEDENELNRSKRKMEECLASILRIGVVCSSDFPKERMDIRDVVMELHVIRNVFLRE